MGGGVFCKNVENVFFVKKVDLPSTQGALFTVSVFFILHFTYLGVYTHPTHPLPTGLRYTVELFWSIFVRVLYQLAMDKNFPLATCVLYKIQCPRSQ